MSLLMMPASVYGILSDKQLASLDNFGAEICNKNFKNYDPLGCLSFMLGEYFLDKNNLCVDRDCLTLFRFPRYAP